MRSLPVGVLALGLLAILTPAVLACGGDKEPAAAQSKLTAIPTRLPPFVIGVMESVTGPGETYGTVAVQAKQMAAGGVNGFVHYRLRRDRTVTWRWLFFLSGMDIALITAIVIIGGDFHLFSYVTYYPALALFAVVFPSLWLSLAWATMAGAVYAVVSLTVGPGLDFDAGQEKALLFRVVAMYAVVASVSLIARFERVRRQESAERERELLRERIELSQAIHDTAAQTAYMIGLGIRKAMRLAGGSNEELTATLAATASLSKAAIWELRRPIDEGHLFEGRELGRVLWSHIETFERVASVPAEMLQSGTEPPPCRGNPGPPLLHRPQRAHQRIPARRGRQGRGPAGLRDRLYPAVRLGRRGRPARGLRRARPGIQGHEGGRRAAGRQAHRGDGRRQWGNDRDLRDALPIVAERRPRCRRRNGSR